MKSNTWIVTLRVPQWLAPLKWRPMSSFISHQSIIPMWTWHHSMMVFLIWPTHSLISCMSCRWGSKPSWNNALAQVEFASLGTADSAALFKQKWQLFLSHKFEVAHLEVVVVSLGFDLILALTKRSQRFFGCLWLVVLERHKMSELLETIHSRILSPWWKVMMRKTFSPSY